MKKLYLLLPLLLFLLPACYGQYPSVFHLSTQNGLVSLNTFRICQDTRGYLWIATEYGLVRYDGKHSRSYSTTEGIGSNSIIHVDLDRDNRLWVHSYGYGTYIFSGDSFCHAYTPAGWLKHSVRSLHSAKSDWIMTSSRHLYRYEKGQNTEMKDKKGKSIRCHGAALLSPYLSCFLGAGGLHIFDDRCRSWVPVPEVFRPYAFESITCHNGLFAGFTKEEVVFIRNDSLLRVVKLPAGTSCNVTFIDRRGNTWFDSKGSFMRIDTTGQVQDYSAIFPSAYTRLNDIFEDSNGNIWLATYGAGVYCIRNNHIENIPVTKGRVHNYVNLLKTHNNTVFIASLGAITGWENDHFAPPEAAMPDPGNFTYFMRVNGDTLMMGTGKGLYLFTGKDFNCSRFFYHAGGALSCYRHNNGQLWFGCFDGIRVLENGRWKRCGHDYMNSRRINLFYRGDKSGRLYVATDSGVYLYRDKRFVPWFVPAEHESAFITCLHEDEQGALWIGSRKGLFLYAGNSMIPQPMFRNIRISCLFTSRDPGRKFWIGSYEGLFLYENGLFTHYGLEEGLLSDQVLALEQDHRGRLLIGTSEGVSVFSYREGKATRGSAQVYITRVYTGNDKKAYGPVLNLSSGDKNIRVEYVGVHLPVSRHLRFQYRILGYDDEWVNTEGDILQLSGLPAGNYTLQVRGRLPHQDSYTDHASLKLHVSKPFFETWFFLAGAGSLTILLLCIGVNHAVRKKEKQARLHRRKKLRLLYARLQVIHTVLKPHFIFNCMNSVLALIRSNRKKEAEYYIINLSRLLRTSLESSTHIMLPLEKEIERLEAYLSLERMRLNESFDFNISLCENIQPGNIMIPTMSVQPFVENAVKHGLSSHAGGKLDISFSREQDILLIRVTDNGRGYLNQPPVKGHRSMGISLVKGMMKLMNELRTEGHEVKIYPGRQSAPGGTVVDIRIPIYTG